MGDMGSSQPVAPTLGDGRYIIGRELGRGTMGVVYEAVDTVLARTVAVKTIELAFAAGDAARKEFEQRFFTEARVAARLNHPGIVVCHDVGKDPASGKLFIVFEYLKGRTLADRMADGAMAWRGALAIVVQVARAIHHAHEHGVIHRDLKPANIMLLESRTGAAVKIMDFGVARQEALGPRLTGPGQSFGSPLYTSPEQALGENSSARSDIFSLGSVLCTLLLGRPWFAAPSIPEIVARVVHDDPPRVSRLQPGVPEAMDAVMAAALARREDDRYATAADMADDLEDVLAGAIPRHAGAVARGSAEDPLLEGLVAPAGGPVRASAPDPSSALVSLLDAATISIPKPHRTPATPSRRRWLVAAGAVTALALAAGVAYVRWPRPAPVLPTPEPSTPLVVAVPEASAAAPSAPPVSLETPPAPSAEPVATEAPPAVAAGVTPPPSARPAEAAGRTAEAVTVTPAELPARTRMRVNVEHPLENGRLVMWIDGVLVLEAKLQAPVAKRIVAIKVRDGRLDRVLDVTPGRHEVRVEVTWDQERRTASKVADVAPNATGLLGIRVGRMSKDLTLEWSRLARD
jgi:serine/threonine-protein kinase